MIPASRVLLSVHVNCGSPLLPDSGKIVDLRAAIVNAVAWLMNENGMSATSIDDVLRASGSDRAQSDLYFQTKAELLRAVARRQLEMLLNGQPGIERIESWASLELWGAEVCAAQQGFDRPFACP